MSQNSLELMLPKGMCDISPADKILQQEVLDAIRSIFESYGYLPLETPLVERMDVLKAKFAAGEGTDVSKEIFNVTDQGERELGLRFDMTVPLARYVAMNPMVKLPFKRYAMGKVFRDGPIKLGRYREFWQADADIIGAPGPLADAEGVQMAAALFAKLDLDVTIPFSSRELLAEMMDKVGIAEEQRGAAVIALDKLKKIGKEAVKKEMMENGVSGEQCDELMTMTQLNGSNTEKLDSLENSLGESPAVQRLRQIIEILKDIPNLEFDPSLARGLGYYTGFFFETFLLKSKISSSLVGTGRYDKMVGQFSNGKIDVAGVGMSFGVSVICDALREKRENFRKSVTQVYVVPVSENEVGYATEVARMLRDSGLNTEMDLVGKSIGKNFSYADSLGIPVVVIVGENELKERTCSVKVMVSGDQFSTGFSDLFEKIKSSL